MGAQGSVANAKEDTVALFDASVFTTDLSHFALPLTASGTGGYKTSDARRAITGATGRELAARLAFATPMKGKVILAHADPAAATSNTYAITTNGSSEIVFMQGSTSLYTRVLPDPCDVLLLWHTWANPDTTGAGDALLSEFAAYDYTNAEWLIAEQVTHAVPTTNAAWTTHVGGFWDGAVFGSLSGQVSELRIGLAGDHSTAEAGEDFETARAAPEDDDSPISAVLPLDGDSGLADEGEFAGAANVGWMAQHNSTQRRALLSPMVCGSFRDAEAFSTTPDPTAWIRDAPGSTDFELRLESLRWLSVPAGVSHASVRVQVKCTGVAVPQRVRVYAFNRPPESPAKSEQPKAPALDFTFIEADELELVHAGVGEWLTWSGDETGLLRLPLWMPDVPAYRSTVHLALAYWVSDPAGSLQIRAWHARPTVKFIGQGIG
jgi:hypothetical protein